MYNIHCIYIACRRTRCLRTTDGGGGGGSICKLTDYDAKRLQVERRADCVDRGGHRYRHDHGTPGVQVLFPDHDQRTAGQRGADGPTSVIAMGQTNWPIKRSRVNDAYRAPVSDLRFHS